MSTHMGINESRAAFQWLSANGHTCGDITHYRDASLADLVAAHYPGGVAAFAASGREPVVTADVPPAPGERRPGTVVILKRRGASLPVTVLGHRHVDGAIRYRVRTANDYLLTDVDPAWLSLPPTEIRNQEDARSLGVVRAYEAPLDVEPLDLSGVVAAEARRLGATPQRADVAGREAFIIVRRRQAAAHAAGEWCHGNRCLCGAPRSDGTRVDVDDATAATYRQLARA